MSYETAILINTKAGDRFAAAHNNAIQFLQEIGSVLISYKNAILKQTYL
ncbi:hypothetical protein [Pajaroellobacter abortibovis]|nr:hypothetical protein [Pajaroellobacter abortibovis]